MTYLQDKAVDALMRLMQSDNPNPEQARDAVMAIAHAGQELARNERNGELESKPFPTVNRQLVKTRVGDAAADGQKRQFRVTWRRPDGQLDHSVGEAVSAEHAVWTVALMVAPESGWVSLVSVEPVGA